MEEGGEGVAEAPEFGFLGCEGVVGVFLPLEGFLDLGEGCGDGVLIFDVVVCDGFIAATALGVLVRFGCAGVGGSYLEDEIDHFFHGFRVVFLVLEGPSLCDIVVVFFAVEDRD